MNKKSLSARLWNILADDVPAAQLPTYLTTTRLDTITTDRKNFLTAGTSAMVSSWLLSDMEKAVQRIIQAIDAEERIIVYGDFDTDGITSTVIFVRGLEQLGAKISYRIPDREKDGHGLKSYVLTPLVAKGVSLVITCDCGINDAQEVAFAAQNNLDIIVTDHHHSRSEDFPHQAVAVVNPQISPDFPDKHLSGSAVAFLVLKAVFERISGGELDADFFLAPYYEMATLGIIADCVPLVGHNRIIAKQGLEYMKSTQWFGLQTLFDGTNTRPESIDEQTVGFAIAPRLNAASRVGNVLQAVQLFLGEDVDQGRRFLHLDGLNALRKELTYRSVETANSQIQAEQRHQLLFDADWRPGILGLVASRFTEKMGQPVIACTQNEAGFIACSCRAPKNYCMISSLNSCRELFEVFGGHAGAAGFQIQPALLPALKTALSHYFDQITPAPLTLDIDGWIDPQQVSPQLLRSLQCLKPFGVGNEEPVFGIRDCEIRDVSLLGAKKNHARITCTTKKNETPFFIMAFFADQFIPDLVVGARFHLACKIKEDWFRGKKQVKWHLVDLMNIETGSKFFA
jgi:single-stranded-DNA-specific exonuclease